jgi:hypothetical protein
MLVIAPAVPETFVPDAEDGFVRMGILACGSHCAARQDPCSVRVFRLPHIIQGRCPVPIIQEC